MLDPDAAQIAQYACAQPTMRERGLPALRATMDDLPLPSGLPTMADTQDLVIPGPHGAIGLTVHRPADDDDAPVLVYFHGGGMCLGSNRSFEPLARNLAHASGATVIAVDYHLAPEDPPPAQFDDAWTATVWVAEHAGEAPRGPGAPCRGRRQRRGQPGRRCRTGSPRPGCRPSACRCSSTPGWTVT